MPFTKPDKIDGWIISLYWLMAAPFILYGYLKRVDIGSALILYMYNVWQFTIMALLIVFYLVPTLFNKKKFILFFVLLFLIFSVGAIMEIWFYWYMMPGFLPFNIDGFLVSLIAIGQQFGVLGVILIGKQYLQYQQKFLLAEKGKTEAELKLLKSQINPHFLFNNLNILGALIDQDQHLAKGYLKRFAALYRYLLTNKENDTVLLSEELAFVKDYIYLLESRFGKAYNFQWELEPLDTQNLLIIPAAMQMLIENVIKHNEGDEKEPLQIHIHVKNERVSILNKHRPKLHQKVISTGTGLDNLRLRYALLTDQTIEIQKEDTFFMVSIPLLKNLTDL